VQVARRDLLTGAGLAQHEDVERRGGNLLEVGGDAVERAASNQAGAGAAPPLGAARHHAVDAIAGVVGGRAIDHLQDRVADPDLAARLQARDLDPPAIDEGAVATLEIAQDAGCPLPIDLGVPSGHGAHRQVDGERRVPAKGRSPRAQRPGCRQGRERLRVQQYQARLQGIHRRAARPQAWEFRHGVGLVLAHGPPARG